MDRHAAVGLDHDQPVGLGEVGVEPTGRIRYEWNLVDCRVLSPETGPAANPGWQVATCVMPDAGFGGVGTWQYETGCNTNGGGS